ncbi:hypothetical protein [Qipengyuania zhejiangensis]|uniref:hypothetical protein n=1 Tax=Qipengyuania zhejiangensis TaxID=3077782 RepID=UPI002D790C5A|nr:hypothetical protein [Qipengyuania sp. Z2]
MTEFTTEPDFEALAMRVIDTTLPRDAWTHTAHFALALWILRHRPDLGDPGRFRELIVRLNDAHGTPNTEDSGYHHTITVASLRATRALLAQHPPTTPLVPILAELLAGPYARPDWIFAYWSPARLFSAHARREWVEPDVSELPF